MTLERRIASVFVPWEWVEEKQQWVKRDDLPRFRTPEGAAAFFQENPEVSFRNGKGVPLEWREQFEREFVREYLAGVGTTHLDRRKLT